MVLRVKNDPPRIARSVLAESIVKLSDAVRSLDSSGLNQKAIVLLLHDMTKLSKRDIEMVLRAIPQLKNRYCK